MRIYNFRFSIQTLIISAAILAGVLINAGFRLALAAVENATIQFKRNPATGLFTISIKDPQGIKELNIVPAGNKFPYGGAMGGCPRSHLIDNTVFDDPTDFTPYMKVIIVDCSGATSEFQVEPPKDGFATGVLKSKIEAQKKLEEQKKIDEEKKLTEQDKPVAPQPKTKEEAISFGTDDEGGEVEDKGGAKAKIVYPVSSLGDCKNETACREYCDDSAHIKECVAFAEANGLLGGKELDRAKKFSEVADRKGPGGCDGDKECQIYCENSDHIEECVEFAERHGFLSADELSEAKKFLPLIKSGQTPGGCKSKESCEAYCEKSENIESCLAFAKDNGLIEPEELAMAQKMLPLIKSGQTPGGCKNKAQCETYCQDPKNMRSCLAFAEEQGIIPPEELEQAKKFLPLMERGETPGGCRSKEQCEAYCDGEGHFEECIEFGVKAGVVSEEEATMIKKAGGKGPGGCRSKEKCEAYCNEEEHQDECFEFAEKAGILGPEQKKMMEFAKKLGCKNEADCRAICSDPEKGKQCQEFFKDAGIDIPGGVGGPGGFAGPGGCKSEDECKEFCEENPEECQNFMPPGGGDFQADFNGGDGEARKQFYGEVRQEHVENVKLDSPQILNCLRSMVGDEVFGRRQAGRIIDEAEGRLVKETLLSCGAKVGPDRAPTPEDLERIKKERADRMKSQVAPAYPGGGDSSQQLSEEQYRRQYEDQYKAQYEGQMRQFQDQIPPQYQQYRSQ